jgi:hypothetical protein
MKIFDFFKKKTEVSKLQFQVQPDLFTCHYCSHQFEVTDKMIFPTSVRLLYKDQFVTGKGVTCPKCHKDCIFG